MNGLAANIAKHASMFSTSFRTLRQGVYSKIDDDEFPEVKEARTCVGDDECSSDEEDMDTLRRRSKQASQAVVSSRGLPAGAVRETRKKSSWASISVLQDAMEVLQGILSQPTKQNAQEFNAVEPATKAVDPFEIPAMPRPTRPATAKDKTSRPSSCAASHSVELERRLRPVSASKAGHPSVLSSKALTSLKQLPPVTPPRKGAPVAPAAPFGASAMDLDLGDRLCSRTGTPPQQTRQSRSVGSSTHRVTKNASGVALPVLVGSKAGARIPFGAQSASKMRTGSVGATLWGHSPVNRETEMDNRPILF